MALPQSVTNGAPRMAASRTSRRHRRSLHRPQRPAEDDAREL